MTELVQRQLTPIEIKQRQVDHLRLLTEIDNYQDEVAEHQRNAKDAKLEIERLIQRERALRDELRSGCVWEARQKKLDFADGSNDEPSEDIDPPEHEKPELTTYDGAPDSFSAKWPAARDAEQLRADLSVALQGVGVPTLDQLRTFHPSTAAFQELAHWARLEVAHMNASEYPEIELPSRLVKPAPLVMFAKEKAPKKKRAKKPKQEPLNGSNDNRPAPNAG